MISARRLVAALLVAASAIAASGCGRYLQAAAAVVDGRVIDLDDLDRAVDAALSGQQEAGEPQRLETARRILAQMIQDRIIEAEARARTITIDPKIVEDRYQAVRAQFPSEEQFVETLAQQGIDPASIRDRIRLRLVVERIQEIFSKETKVSDAEIRAAYGDGAAFDEVRVRHIQFAVADPSGAQAALREAQDAARRLRAGADFATLARQLSDDEDTKARGGDLGTLQRGAVPGAQSLEAVAFGLKVGEISDPVRSAVGYHVLQVTARGRKTLAQATPELRAQLASQAAQAAFQKFITDRIAAATIRVNPRYGEFDPATLTIVERRFFTPASPPAVPEGIPGLQLPLPDQP